MAMAMNKIFQTHDDLYIFKVLKTVLESDNQKRSLLNLSDVTIGNKPDIILLDLIKPHQNGIQIANNIKTILDEIPIVIMASQLQSRQTPGFLYEQLLDFFYHEIRRDDLLSWIRNYLEHHSNFDPKLFYENLIISQLHEIIGNWKKTIRKQFPEKVNTRSNIYLDALFLFNQPVQVEQQDNQFDDQSPLEQTLVNVVEFCPDCFRYDVRLSYVCPTCDSKHLETNLSQEFANITFTCANCAKQIEAPKVQGFCKNCNRIFRSEKIIKQKIYKYQLPPEESFQKTSTKDTANIACVREKPVNPVLVDRKEQDQLISQKKYSTNFLLLAFHENKIPHLSCDRFRSQMSKEIDFASLNKSDLTVMTLAVANFDQILLRYNSHIIISMFKSILTVATEYLRPSDILSYDEVHQKLLVMLPNTHLKIAKIIAKKILQRFERFQGKFLIEVLFASYPQDGKNIDEVLEIMNMGFEKVTSDFLGEGR